MIISKLRDVREDKELTQKDVGDILGVDRSTYGGWEIGKDTIPLRKLYELSKYYDISLDYLFGLSDNKNIVYKSSEINIELVGKKLKQIREENNLTQQDIADLLNTSKSTYNAYENGKVLILTSSLYAIAEKYDCSIDWILGD